MECDVIFAASVMIGRQRTMSDLGKKLGTVGKESPCITGYGASLRTVDGDECAIMAPTMRGLELIWGRLSWMHPLDKTKVRRVAYFKHEDVTSLKTRKKPSHDSATPREG